ncbi:MAG: hypothetical protein WCF23_06835 [Candidatus Nitrosopolaris sp.]
MTTILLFLVGIIPLLLVPLANAQTLSELQQQTKQACQDLKTAMLKQNTTLADYRGQLADYNNTCGSIVGALPSK